MDGKTDCGIHTGQDASLRGGMLSLLITAVLLLSVGCDTLGVQIEAQPTVTPTLVPTATPSSVAPSATPSSTPSQTSTPTGTSTPTPTPSAQAQEVVSPTATPQPSPAHNIKTAFVIMMENHNWAEIKQNPSAPYINKVLLPAGSHAEQYYNPPGIHPSEPNYLWLEAGTGFGISNDDDPPANHQATTGHLVTLLDNAGISWKAYQEGISGKQCPLVSKGLYAAKHNPMVYFDDVTGGNNLTSPYCIAHERPYAELTTDLQNNTVARYNFITPNLCHDMHNSFGCATLDSITNGDNWLAAEVPKILESQAYKDGGALIIAWDEAENGTDGPIGMIVLSPYAKGSGYSNASRYTHGSTLRTIEEIFGVTPLLRDAAGASDLSDLFQAFP